MAISWIPFLLLGSLFTPAAQPTVTIEGRITTAGDRPFSDFQVRTSSDGEALRRQFEKVEALLQRSYGKPRSHEVLQPWSRWRRPEHWMMSLFRQDRTVQSEWICSKRRRDHLKRIRLSIRAVDTATGFLMLEFTGDKWPQCLQEE